MRNRIGSFYFIYLPMVVWLAYSCTQKQEKEVLSQPNILWITTEDISPALGCYGDSLATTPHLDQLAKEGVLYTNAYTSAPICTPARSCLITGVYATSLGTQHLRSEVKIPDFVRGLPRYMQDTGYFTFLYGKTDYNFDPAGMWDYREKELTPWRQRKGKQPFFGMYTIGETHEGSVNIEEKYRQSVAGLPDSLFHDPDVMQVPPYYPNTPEFRDMWADYYDLVSGMDQTVGKIVQALKVEGLYDETIIFFFSDHGFGLPRYKRWLYKTGLQVPLIVRVPPKYQHLIPHQPGDKSQELVSFVDMAPSVLNLAGMTVPDYMEGQTFLGENLPAPRKYVFGARSRADNMYDISRAVMDKRYIYIRHYFPHYAYIQPGYIFSDRKRSLRELRRLKEQGLLQEEALEMWQSRPVEELYDLQQDPHELNNLANAPEHGQVMDSMRSEMHHWIRKYHDTGFLLEPEMMIRAQGSTPYEMAHQPSQYHLAEVLEAAEMVGKAEIPALVEKLQHEDGGVRFWAVMALQAKGEAATQAIQALEGILQDTSPSVQIAAAETLCHWGKYTQALPVLQRWVQDDRPWVALQAARSIELIGSRAKPLVPVMYQVLEKYAAPSGSELRYKNFNFAAFISWSLEWALHHCGENMEILRKDMI